MSDINNNTADTNETATGEAAVEQQPKRAASEISANLRGSPTNTLRRELQAMMRKVEELSGQLAEERSQRELLTHQLAAKTTNISAQVEAAPSAGAKAKETEPITPGQAVNAAEDNSAHVEQTDLPPARAGETEAATEEVEQAAETAPGAAAKLLTFDALLASMDDNQRDIIEKHIVGLRTALETERGDRKAAQKAVRSAQGELEQLKTLQQQLQDAEARAQDAQAAALFFETAATNNVKRHSMRLAFLAAQDSQLFGDDGAVQWEALQARFPDLFEGTNNRPAPDGAKRDTTGPQQTVGSERPAPAPRTSASAGAGAGAAPPRRPFSMSSAIRSAAGRKV